MRLNIIKRSSRTKMITLVLNVVARGFLEQTIDQAIRDIPYSVRLYRDERRKKTYQYQSAEDFVTGLTAGRILFSFGSIFKLANNRWFNEDELNEVHTIIYKRFPEIRSALFKAG